MEELLSQFFLLEDSWFFWSCWLLLSRSLLSSQQVEPSRSWPSMPTCSICFPLVEAQHGTSSIARMHQHASWCQGLVVLGKAMLDQQLADGICLLVNWRRTCLDGFNFPLQVCWESHGSTLSTSWHLDHCLWLVWFSLMPIMLQMSTLFPIIACKANQAEIMP